MYDVISTWYCSARMLVPTLSLWLGMLSCFDHPTRKRSLPESVEKCLLFFSLVKKFEELWKRLFTRRDSIVVVDASVEVYPCKTVSLSWRDLSYIQSGQPYRRDHPKFWIPTNQRRQTLDPNQSDLWNSKRPLRLATLCVTCLSIFIW